MKRPIVLIGIGILCLFALTVVVSGEYIISESKTQTKVERQNQLTTSVLDQSSNEVAITEVTPADGYDISWQSINAGSDDKQSTNYRMLSSTGQSAIGFGTGDNYQVGMGYWYGFAVQPCDCGTYWGDLTCDAALNPVDVVYVVNCVYLNNCMFCYPPSWNCPHEMGDVNCDGNLNPVDVVLYVNCVYLGNCMFCADPCL